MEHVIPKAGLLNIKAGAKIEKSTPSSFCSLPAELRNQIYSLVLIDPDSIYIQSNLISGSHHRSSASSEAAHTSSPTSFLDTCRQMRKEATLLYYAQNVFTFPSGTAFMRFTKRTPTIYVTQIREIRIHLQSGDLQLLEFWDAIWAPKWRKLRQLGLAFGPKTNQQPWLVNWLMRMQSLRHVTLGLWDRESCRWVLSNYTGWAGFMADLEMRMLKKWEATMNKTLEQKWIDGGGRGKEKKSIISSQIKES